MPLSSLSKLLTFLMRKYLHCLCKTNTSRFKYANYGRP